MSLIRTLVPIVPNGDVRRREEVSKRKQPKSRNGCITCKAKRMKCDETKPACQQCSRRQVECGGYAQILRWKSVGKIKDGKRAEESTATNIADNGLESSLSTMNFVFPIQLNGPTQDDDGVLLDGSLPLSAQTAGLQRSTSSSNKVLPILQLPTSNQSTISLHDSVERQNPQYNTNGMYQNLNATSSDPVHQDGNLLSACSPSQSLNLTDFDLFLAENGMDLAAHNQQTPQLAELLRSPFNTAAYGSLNWSPQHLDFDMDTTESFNDGLAEDTSTLDMSDNAIQPLQTCPPTFNLQVITALTQSYQDSQSSTVIQERIRHVFELHTCKILSIKEDDAQNPWKTIIWPLASQYPALYHALAALTCLHLCRIRPELRVHGLRHFRQSAQALDISADDESTPLELTIATRLALGLAECYDYRKSVTGIHQIDLTGALVQQAISKHQHAKLETGELTCIGFLANTWMYLDIVAHFSCPDRERSTNSDLFTACIVLNQASREQQVDPLMGCAVTLFPLLGQLQDLVARVRKRPEKRNSPAIISKAIDLWMAIEKWVPPVDIEKSENTTNGATISNIISDSIQTAEAYRWSALVMLRQTVPELPWSHSVWELAQKALVFLATVPMSSRTIIMHIFPLLCAGAESLDEEDRDWIRDRWKLMSQRMITGIVDRCNKVTVEVWRRRDEHILANPICRSSATTGRCRVGLHTKSSMLSATTPKDFTTGCTCSTSPDARAISCSPPSSDFPESVAFKKNIDPLTRGGSIRYTVKGDLHWLGVMEDWGWQVLLG